MWFMPRKRLATLTYALPREELLRRSRILVVDDERPELIDDRKAARFAVDYVPDIGRDQLNLIDTPLYDLILLDFGGVGASFGDDQGLSLLRHIKRVNPAVIVLAYTSKALRTEHADFFRQVDGILAKDAGIAESSQRIEDALRKAHSLDNVWNGILTLADVRPGSTQDQEWQDLFVRGLTNGRIRKRLATTVVDLLSTDAAKAVGAILLEKAVELGVKATTGV